MIRNQGHSSKELNDSRGLDCLHRSWLRIATAQYRMPIEGQHWVEV